MSRLQRMHDALSSHLTPDVLTLENESSHHRVPVGSETHVKLTVVSTAFCGLNRIARHRLVHAIIQPEFALGLHALTLHLYTPSEWEQPSRSDIRKSPTCLGGSHSKGLA